ncbi:MAG: SlyX protein [bacterium]|nr:SlyX protein [bacterium]
MRAAYSLKGYTMTAEKRIEQLEIKVSYLENYVDELNEVILEQKNSLDLINEKIDKLYGYINNDNTNVDSNEKPPHY